MMVTDPDGDVAFLNFYGDLNQMVVHSVANGTRFLKLFLTSHHLILSQLVFSGLSRGQSWSEAD